jgi:hypothetical protein
MTTATEEVSFTTCLFRLDDVEVSSQQGDGKPERRAFKGKANTGQPFPQLFGGKAIIDMASLRVDRQKLSVLKDHYAEIGFTNKLAVGDQGIDVEGVLLGVNEIGRETIAFLDAGMPWQMSVYVPPENILRVAEGESIEVNGKLRKGPISVWQGCALRECTITALGRDGNTSVSLLGAGRERNSLTVPVHQEEKAMAKQDDGAAPVAQTPAQLKEQSPGLYEAVLKIGRDEGEKLGVEAERKRIADIRARAKDIDPKLVDKAIEDGLSVADAVDSFLSYMQSRKEGRLAAVRAEHTETVGVDDSEAAAELTEFAEGAPEGKAAKTAFERLPEGDEKWKQGFEKHGDAALGMTAAQLQDEFGDVEIYLAFKRHTPAAAK